MPSPAINGLHHVTALCGDPQRNLDFYTQVLGLRLVKKTVNFDDPSAYHFYYADGAGTPGSVLTFFPWRDLPAGRRGTGQAGATAFAIPESASGYWEQRLKSHGIDVRGPQDRFGAPVWEFPDPDGLPLELVVAEPPAAFSPWAGSPVPEGHQLRGFHSITLVEERREPTHELLTRQMGWTKLAEAGNRLRYAAPAGGSATLVDVLVAPELHHGTSGSGTVHHVAFRVDDVPAQEFWKRKLGEAGHHVSPVMDRSYFHSIYYREPGGILFEIATNPPGFATDESLAALGTGLMLPPQYEGMRPRIEQSLPPLRTAAASGPAA